MAKSKKVKMPDGGKISRYVGKNNQPLPTNLDYMRMPSSSDNEVIDWNVNYINSPKYKERLSNFYDNPDKISKKRAKKAQQVEILVNEDSKTFGPAYNLSYDGSNGIVNQVYMNNQAMYNSGMSREETLMHELSHSTNGNRDVDLRLLPEEERYMFDKERLIGKPTSTKGKPIEKFAKENNLTLSNALIHSYQMHDVAPSELKSDMDSFRYLLDKTKLYKAGTEDMNMEILNKAKKDPRINNSFNFKRLQDHYDDQDLIDIMNKIALNSNSQKPIAKNGIKMPDGGKTNPNGIVNPVDRRAYDWTQSYINSPKYRERLGNFWQYPEYVQRQRANQVAGTQFRQDFNRTAYSDTNEYPNQINVSQNQLNAIGAGRGEAVAHELSHATNASISNPALRLNPSEEQFIFNRNNTIVPGVRSSIVQGAAQSNESLSRYLQGETHDIAPSESKSDIDALRFLMNQEGIYDAGTQDLTPELLKKAKSNPNIKKAFAPKRLFKNFQDADLIEIMNKVAVDNVTPIPIAKDGIHINPDHRGDFTAWSKKHGMSVRKAANHVMANKEDYSPHVVQMANFAKNFGGKKKAQFGTQIPDPPTQFPDPNYQYLDEVLVPTVLDNQRLTYLNDVQPVYGNNPANIDSSLQNTPQPIPLRDTQSPAPSATVGNRGGRGINFGSMNINLGTAITGLAGAANQAFRQANTASEAARNQRLTLQQETYNPYAYGTGSQAIFEHGGKIPDKIYDLSPKDIKRLEAQGYIVEKLK